MNQNGLLPSSPPPKMSGVPPPIENRSVTPTCTKGNEQLVNARNTPSPPFERSSRGREQQPRIVRIGRQEFTGDNLAADDSQVHDLRARNGHYDASNAAKLNHVVVD